MAYNDYGAFVFQNDVRRPDKEDAPLFASSEDAFGIDISKIPAGFRIFQNLQHINETEFSLDTLTEEQRHIIYIRDHITHGVLGDGLLRVRCYKQGLPTIWKLKDDGDLEEIAVPCEDHYDYGTVDFKYDGYTFNFVDGLDGGPYVASMIEPDGTQWRCEYDYEYGAGFEESDFDDSTT